MVMPQFMEVGPVNGAILLVMLIAATVAAGLALRSIRAGDEPNLWPVVTTLALPLIFSVYAGTWQLDAGFDHAVNHPKALARQTLMAMALPTVRR